MPASTKAMEKRLGGLFREDSIKSLFLLRGSSLGVGRFRNWAGCNCQTVPGIDDGDGESQVGQFLFAEVLANFLVDRSGAWPSVIRVTASVQEPKGFCVRGGRERRVCFRRLKSPTFSHRTRKRWAAGRSRSLPTLPFALFLCGRGNSPAATRSHGISRFGNDAPFWRDLS
jgi:hypothetical protein